MIYSAPYEYLTFTSERKQNIVSVKLIKEQHGSWELDLLDNKLFWSDNQYKIYGYAPGEILLDPEYFLKKTTSPSDLDRINAIVSNALKNCGSYTFKRRIVKKNGELSFAETTAVIIRSKEGIPIKIIGVTVDISGKSNNEHINYNDPCVFNSIYLNYRKSLLSEIKKIVKEEELANDLCQEVFIKAWNNMYQYSLEKGTIYTWLVTIARNHCRDHFRSKAFKKKQNTCTIDNICPSTIKLESFDLIHHDITQLLAQLSFEQKEIIELLFIEGFTQSEVALMKGMPLGTVKTKSRNAICKLKELV